MGQRYNNSQFEAAIRNSGGIIATIAKRVGCDWCNANGAVWVAEDMDRAKGKYLDSIGSEVNHG